MNIFTTDKIRNVVLLGHTGAGKTGLANALVKISGGEEKRGAVETTKSTAVIPVVWGDTKINILDTPGSPDFIGEIEEAVSAADAAIIVVSGKTGFQTGTKQAFKLCDKYNLPRMVYVSNMDFDDASYKNVVLALQERYGKCIAPFHMPMRENQKFVGYVNIIQEKAKRWMPDGTVEKSDVPDYSTENLSIYRDVLMEAVAETSEEFLDRYFNGDTFSENEIRQALRVSVEAASIVPVMMGASTELHGIYTLLSDIVKYLPSPDRRKVAGINATSNAVFNADYNFALAKSAYVFKTIVDPFIGKYSLIKVNSGVLKTDDLLYNHHKSVEEKIGKLYVMNGTKAEEVAELHAGDIGALSKINSLQTTDSLSTKANPILYIRASISTPYVSMRYNAVNEKDEDKAGQSLNKLAQEDLTLKVVNDPENHQTLLYGISQKHLESIAARLKETYGVEITLSAPKISYRETITGNSDVESKYKKQSGGHGQYGHVKMRFEPSGDLETPYVFAEEVVGGAVPKNFFPAVEKGIAEGTLRGPLCGFPVIGVKTTLYDGSYHPVDSSEAAFKTAAIDAFKDGVMKAKPILLEPIASLSVTCPEANIGDVMGDLNKRRARVLEMNPIDGGDQVIKAEIPYAQLYGYEVALRSVTGGEGIYSYEFLKYDRYSGEGDLPKNE